MRMFDIHENLVKLDCPFPSNSYLDSLLNSTSENLNQFCECTDNVRVDL